MGRLERSGKPEPRILSIDVSTLNGEVMATVCAEEGWTKSQVLAAMQASVPSGHDVKILLLPCGRRLSNSDVRWLPEETSALHAVLEETRPVLAETSCPFTCDPNYYAWTLVPYS